MNRLSQRLGKICSLVPLGARVCDIGTDHGYLAIELIKSGRASSVIAADVNQKPLENAKSNIEESQIKGIELRLCDGFNGIESYEFDTAVIAGMGGEVIAGIIERCLNTLKQDGKLLILQPTTSPEFLRRFLNHEGFSVKEEIPVFENKKLYSVMKVLYSGETSPLEEYKYFVGNLLPVGDGLEYIKKQQKRCFECMKSLENIPRKKDQYQYYKSLYEKISDYIK